MLKIDIITLFPDTLQNLLDYSMLHKALEMKVVSLNYINLRDFGLGVRKQVDDTPYGGGAGMLLKPEPIFDAVEFCKSKNPNAKVILTSARGSIYKQATAQSLAGESGLIIICGHYEGVDERVMDIVDYELTLGDFVLSGGEYPALIIADSVIRLLPGVLGADDGLSYESFNTSLLEYPQYTKPVDYHGRMVPEVLLKGNHADITSWRRLHAIAKTRSVRPDRVQF